MNDESSARSNDDLPACISSSDMSDPAPETFRMDPVVSGHLAMLQDRYADFQTKRRKTVRVEGQGTLNQIWNEYFGFGNKENLGLMLRGMLHDEELEWLRTDEKFTTAWGIFVDFCWVRRLMVRGLVIFFGFLAALAFVGWAGWSFYQLIIWVLSPRK